MTPSGPPELLPDQGLAVSRLWGVPMGSRPGPRPRLALPEIVNAAVTLARAEGLPAVTMMRVAEEVGCSKMALYRHVSDHGDMLSAMLDAALGEPPRLAGSWRERFATLWEALLDLYSRDAWLLDLPSDTNGLTPRNVAWIDAALGLFAGSTLPAAERLGVVHLMTENVRFEARHRRSAEENVDDLDRLIASAAQASAYLPVERFPHLAALSQHHREAPSVSDRYVRELMLRSLERYFPEERGR